MEKENMEIPNRSDIAPKSPENTSHAQEKQYLPLPLFISWVKDDYSFMSRCLSLVGFEKTYEKIRDYFHKTF